MNEKQSIIDAIDKKKQQYFNCSDQIWEYAETRFNVKKSADALSSLLEKEEFQIEKGLAHMEHSFVATYGTGKPVIGILAEYDALGNMSQVADLPKKSFYQNMEMVTAADIIF